MSAVPSAKRARQRAARQARQAELERKKKNRQFRRRALVGVVAVAAAVGIYFAVSSGSSKTHSSAAKAGTTAPATAAQAAADQQAADKAAVAAGCPSDPKTALHKPTYTAAPAMTIDTADTYTATVKTDVGTFTMALDATQSPVAVNSFVFLADKGFFNCTTFWRAGQGFMIQGGDPTGTGTGGPGYHFTEAGPAAAADPSTQYPLGAVALANSNNPATTDPTTNGSQFFVVSGPDGESLGNDYVLFGQVTSGMKVVDEIAAQGGSASDNYAPPKVVHRMLKVTISTS